MAEEFLIRIIPDGAIGTPATGTTRTSGSTSGINISGVTKGIGNAMGGVLKALGIATGIGIIIQALMSFKPLLSLISGILKAITFILKPIFDVIMLFLLPILLLLKPIVFAVNQIMAPFTKLAMQVMKEGVTKLQAGDIGGGMQNILGSVMIMQAGISSVFTVLFSGILKFILGSLAELFRPIFEFFGVNVDELKTNINTTIDSIGATITTGLAGAAITIAETLGVNTAEFQEAVKKNIQGVFAGDDGVTAKWDAMISTVFGPDGKLAITKTVNDISTTFKDQITGEGGLKEVAVSSINSFVSDAKKAFSKLKDALKDEYEEKMTKSLKENIGGGIGFSGGSGGGR